MRSSHCQQRPSGDAFRVRYKSLLFGKAGRPGYLADHARRKAAVLETRAVKPGGCSRRVLCFHAQSKASEPHACGFQGRVNVARLDNSLMARRSKEVSEWHDLDVHWTRARSWKRTVNTFDRRYSVASVLAQHSKAFGIDRHLSGL